MILDAKLLDVPILRSEQEITSILDHPEQIWFDVGRYHRELPERVSRIVGSSIGQGIPTVSDIAAALNMAPRRSSVHFATSSAPPSGVSATRRYGRRPSKALRMARSRSTIYPSAWASPN